jgi:hypothetical protein
MGKAWREPDSLRWSRIAQRLEDRFDKAKRDPDIAINDPDRAKLIRLANRLTAARARADSLAFGMISTYDTRDC